MDSDEVYDALRAAIASGELQPHTRLVESDLMARHDATRPAVRLALVRLTHEGLVEQQKNHSARVRLVEPDEALEIYQARALLESHAAELAAARISKAEIAELDQLISRAEKSARDDAARYETQFHQKIMDIAADRTIKRLCAGLHGHLLKYHHYTHMVQSWSANSPCEHRDILKALRARDAKAAASAMRKHLDRLTGILRQTLDAEQPR